ncbi:MAG: serine/threonine-protein kinase RsbW [Actinomycetota bacterium]|jgi:serine/threonine-protein kinase RsbW|nr:serine/threonine-protein kinase RsbW [Actinomycetota bacterium]MEA2842637.1 serine/threonine-protein kinase RsbW [Actinomycetota bacterium]
MDDLAGDAVELEIPARAEFVALARLAVSAMAATDGELEDERLDDLKLAVSEACTNAIEAHSSIDNDERVIVRCSVDETGLEVCIADRGPGFDPTRLPDHPPVTDPDRLKFERGLGIPLIRALVDEVGFQSSDKGTEVRLVMRHGHRRDGAFGA